ncbi:MAG TPA: hypothetical protein VFV98_17840 [Vicinamibacterales bacterium]|nr:hypothetical protein [Vicinamibacterales bacterium]
MSRNINVNPAHYKVAGRERQGEAVLQDAQKQAFAKQQESNGRWQAHHGGRAPWETTPPAPLVDTPEERRRAEHAAKRASQRATRRGKPAAKKTAKKSTASRVARKPGGRRKAARKASRA